MKNLKPIFALSALIMSLQDSHSSAQSSEKLFTHPHAKHRTVEATSEVEIAPDGSEVKILGRVPGIMSSIECTFHPGSISKAAYHRTITEIWHVTEGEGYFYRKDLDSGAESCVKITKGTTLTIPKETVFQFKTIGDKPLKFFIATTPPWPGDDEAVFSKGRWKSTL